MTHEIVISHQAVVVRGGGGDPGPRPQEGKNMPNLHAICAAVEQAGQAIATLPVNYWAGWAIYLLEHLDNELQAAGEDPNPVLNAVAQAIDTRRQLGRW